MKDWLDHIKENYPLLSLALIWLGIGVALIIVNIIVNRILDNLTDKKRLQFSFAKSIILGMAIPIIGILMWFSSYDNPFNEYRLITRAVTANGYINKVEQESEVIESNDSRTVSVVDYYYYEFIFKLPTGRTIKSAGKEYGDIPDHLTNVENNPYSVNVEYLSDNPQINRIKGMESGNQSLYEWFRYPILMGVIVLMICSYFGFTIIKSGLKTYRTEMLNLKQNNSR